MRRHRTVPRLLALTILLPGLPGLLALAGCDGGDVSGPGDVASADVGAYLRDLRYDADALLNVQPSDSSRTEREQEALPPERVGNDLRLCTRTTYGLQSNLTEVAVLRPTQGVVWPGALVKANGTLMDGTPEPFTLARAAATLSIDLPGMTDGGTIVVERPTNSSTQAAVNEALEWWNANRYEEGYVNAAQTSFRLTTSYSREQTSLDLALGAGWATGTAEALLSQSTTRERRSLTAVYEQAFYTVTMDTPETPASVFAASVALPDVQAEMTSSAPPAYVASVTYGKVIMARMETTLQTSRRAAEAAFRYATSARTYVEGALDAEERRALASSTIEIVVLGGNAGTATEVVAGTPADVVAGIQSVIRGENAVYSRSNPGAPIAYLVRHLRNNSLVKLGYTTEYTATECQVDRAYATVRVQLERFHVVKDCDGVEGAGDFLFEAEVRANGRASGATTWGSGWLQVDDGGHAAINREYTLELPLAGSPSFSVWARAREGDQNVWGTTYNVWGTTYNDARMDNAAGEVVSRYGSDGTWPNYAPGQRITIPLGADATACRVQLWFKVLSIR